MTGAESDYIVCPDCGTNYVDMDNYRNHRPCHGVRTGEPMDMAWRFLKGAIGSPGDKERVDEQVAQWSAIQGEGKRREQQERMEMPPCDSCKKPGGIWNQNLGQNVCEECSDAITENMRRMLGLPPKETAPPPEGAE